MKNSPDCIICGVKGKPLYSGLKDKLLNNNGEFGFRKCPSCGLLWLDPMPDRDDLKKYYEGYHGLRDDREPLNRPFAFFRDKLREIILCGYYGYRNIHNNHTLCFLGKILGCSPVLRDKANWNYGGERFPHFKKRGALIVDLGCGDGDYLATMQKLGWDVLGVEPDAAGAGIAEKRGIKVVKSSFEETNLSDNVADYVMMNHVLEHLSDPFATIKEVYRILKPQGKLVIHVPNAQSLAHKLFKENCYHLDPPRHLFSFSPESLRLIFKKQKFKEISVRTSERFVRSIYDHSMVISKTAKANMSGRALAQKGRNWFFLKEVFLCCMGQERGEEIEAVAIK